MFLARVEGSVVATKKDEGLSGRKLLLVRPQLVDESDPAKFRPGKNTIVAVDSVGAGEGGTGVVHPRQFRPTGAQHEKRPSGCRGGGHRRYRGRAWPSDLRRKD